MTSRAPRAGRRADRPSRSARIRVALRLARRQLRRSWVSSVLVAALVALPITAMTAFVVYSAGFIATPEERVRVELGEMQGWVSPVAGPDSGLQQALDDPYSVASTGGAAGNTPLPVPDAALPPGTQTVPVREGTVRVGSPAGTAVLQAWEGRTWDERFSGRFDLVRGERPTAADEAMVTPATLDRLGITLGDDVTLESGATFEVTGTLEAATLADDAAAVFLGPDAGVEDELGNAGAASGPWNPRTRWYLPDYAPTADDVGTLNAAGIVVFSRPIVLDPPPVPADAQIRLGGGSPWSQLAPIALGVGAGGLFAAYVVVMLAGAAFAVSARRQQRALALVASVGGERRDLFLAVIAQGTTLGLLGGVVGVGAGIALAAIVDALTRDGSAIRPWGFHAPWAILAAILVFAVIVGSISAIAPARSVARSDVLGSLRGARRPQRPRVSRPIWGSIVLLVGIALTLVSGFGLAAVNASDLDYASPLRYVPAWGIVIGPILAQLGIIFSGRWLLWVGARPLSRIGPAARIAARDAAASAARTVPALAAIGATVFLGMFALSQASMQTASSARTWYWDAPLGTLSIDLQTGFGDVVTVPDERTLTPVAAEARDLAQEAGAVSTAIIYSQPSPWILKVADGVGDARHVLAVLPEEHLLDPRETPTYRSTGTAPENNIAVIDADEIETALGVDIADDALAAYRDGAAMVADSRYVTDGALEVGAWAASASAEGRIPSNVWTAMPDAPDVAEPVATWHVDAVLLDAPHQPVSIAVSPERAAELGIATLPASVVGAFETPPTAATLDRVQAESTVRSTPEVSLTARMVTGPPSDAIWVVPLVSVVAALVVGASAVALSLARFERRPDDATLSAVGGTPMLRRSVAFWQGLIVVGFGTLAGAAAGVLPAVGFSVQSVGELRLSDIPWALLGLFVVALPLAIAAASWMVPPRRPDLARRGAIA